MSEASNDSANPSVGGYSGGSGEAGSTTESDPRNSASGSVGNNPSPRRGDEASHEGGEEGNDDSEGASNALAVVPERVRLAEVPTVSSGFMGERGVPCQRVHEIDALPNLYYFDSSVPYRLPNLDERLDSYSDDQIAISIEAFRHLNIFPLPRVIVQLCTFFDISPSQLMPHIWRLAAVMEQFMRELACELDINHLLTSYALHEVKPGRYSVRNRSKRTPVWTTDKPPNDRQWDERFLMVPVSRLVGPDVHLRRAWRRISKCLPFFV